MGAENRRMSLTGLCLASPCPEDPSPVTLLHSNVLYFHILNKQIRLSCSPLPFAECDLPLFP